jgi:DNA-binding CsgD family transcriptional regulator
MTIRFARGERERAVPDLSIRRVKAEHLLWAPLVFSFLCIIQLPTYGAIDFSLDGAASFLISYLSCGVIAGIACTLTAASPKRLPSLICVLPAIVGLVLVFLYRYAGFGVIIQVPLGSGLLGISSVVLFVSWGQIFASVEPKCLALTIVVDIILALILKLLFYPLSYTVLNLAVIGAAVVISALPLDRMLQQNGKAQKEEGCNFPVSKQAAYRLSYTMFGMMICCMIWGFTWGNSLQGVALAASGASSAILIDVGKLLTAIVLFLLLALRPKPVDLTQGQALSLATGFLLVAWMLMAVAGILSMVVTALISGAGFVMFDIALWIKLGELGRGGGAYSRSARLLVAVARIIVMAVILFGIVIAPVIGAEGAELFTPIFSVVFLILIGTGTTVTKRAVSDKTADKPLSDAVDALPGESVARSLQAEYGFSNREAEVFSYFIKGYSANYISKDLTISTHTVKTHIKRIYEKTGVHSKNELIALFDYYGRH